MGRLIVVKESVHPLSIFQEFYDFTILIKCSSRYNHQMGHHRDISGQKFGLLTATHRDWTVGGKRVKTVWFCRCECGREVRAQTDRLVRGKRTMCVRKNHPEYLTDITLPQHAHPSTHKSWASMISRCIYSSDPKSWRNYGGRGIKVCDRWRSDFWAFLADMGERPDGMSIERTDVDGDYAPSNCVWATMAEQAANRRDTAWVMWEGRDRKFIEVCREVGVDAKLVRSRLNIGWDLERALSVPKRVPAPKLQGPPRRRGRFAHPEIRPMILAGYSTSTIMAKTGVKNCIVSNMRHRIKYGL